MGSDGFIDQIQPKHLFPGQITSSCTFFDVEPCDFMEPLKSLQLLVMVTYHVASLHSFEGFVSPSVLYRAVITTRESATDTSLLTQHDAADFSTTFSLLPALVRWF